jgi:hypothetical protein
MDYIVVIPSYNRAHSLKVHTLQVLEDGLVDKDKIYIFVANDEEYLIYKKILPEYKIIIGVLGLRDQRNFISNYFPQGYNIISIDDDIEKFYQKINGELIIIKDLDSLFINGFLDIINSDLKLFGFYPVLNKLFMKEVVTADLRFIIGSCFGYINSGIFTSITEKDDYERSLLYYLRDGGVLRYNYISTKTKYYKNKGGLQSNGYKDRYDRQLDAVNYLLDTYPEYIKTKKSFKSNFPEIRFIVQKN